MGSRIEFFVVRAEATNIGPSSVRFNAISGRTPRGPVLIGREQKLHVDQGRDNCQHDRDRLSRARLARDCGRAFARPSQPRARNEQRAEEGGCDDGKRKRLLGRYRESRQGRDLSRSPPGRRARNVCANTKTASRRKDSRPGGACHR